MQDTVPPELEFTGELPLSDSSAAVANFSYAASDISGVTMQCRLSTTEETAMVNLTALQEDGPSLHTALSLGQWIGCNTSVTVYWLSPGRITGQDSIQLSSRIGALHCRGIEPKGHNANLDWLSRKTHGWHPTLAVVGNFNSEGDKLHFPKDSPIASPQHIEVLLREICIIGCMGVGNWTFEVTATDAAGNSALTPLAYSWTISLDVGLQYARFLTAPIAMIGDPDPIFDVQVPLQFEALCNFPISILNCCPETVQYP